MPKKMNGIAASSGIAIAKAFKLEHHELTIKKKQVERIEDEIEKFKEALTKSKEELEVIKQKTLHELGEDKAEIFSAHILVLSDPELVDSVINKIKNEKLNAEYALNEIANLFIGTFEAMDNEYMKERAADIRDVTKRVFNHLLGINAVSLSSINEEVILIAEDLTPSDTAQLNRTFVKGFATDIGGRTSHSAIMARSMEIPAVVGTKEVTNQVETGITVIIDGLEGIIIIDPTTEEIDFYNQKKITYDAQKVELAKLVNEQTNSKDGYQVELAANIGTPNDLEGVLKNGAEGIGLYRTEFLYMDREELPTEEEQFQAYKTVLEGMDGKPVVIRTLDIGGDKELPYLHLPKELNPFLGFRAIRLCLEKQDIFRPQLRALLRASVFGNLKIMFPMIATLEEFQKAKSILEEERNQLISENIAVSDNIEIGMMVEIPSTAISADIFAKEIDFFSIGTNDLIQYTMAADRMNEQVSYLYQPYHPAILRLVKLVIDAAHKQGKWVGMCGEMAGDEIAIPILLGLGLDEFSMSASSILSARSQISKLSKEQLTKEVNSVLQLSTAKEVEEFVKNYIMVENN